MILEGNSGFKIKQPLKCKTKASAKITCFSAHKKSNFFLSKANKDFYQTLFI